MCESVCRARDCVRESVCGSVCLRVSVNVCDMSLILTIYTHAAACSTPVLLLIVVGFLLMTLGVVLLFMTFTSALWIGTHTNLLSNLPHFSGIACLSVGFLLIFGGGMYARLCSGGAERA